MAASSLEKRDLRTPARAQQVPHIYRNSRRHGGLIALEGLNRRTGLGPLVPEGRPLSDQYAVR